MTRNHRAHGRTTVTDMDICDLLQSTRKTLPWMAELLEELQYLRDHHDGGEDGARHLDDELLPVKDRDRVAYLEHLLDSVGAKYDNED